MNLVLNTAPSQTRQASTAEDLAQSAPVRLAATQGTDGDQIAHPAKRAAGTASNTAANGAPRRETAPAQNAAAKPASTDKAPASTSNAAPSAPPPLFAQLLDQTATASKTGADAGADGVAKSDGNSDDKNDPQTATAANTTDALLQAMAAPVMALPVAPAAPDNTGAASTAGAAPVGAAPQSAAQAPASLAALLTVINPTAALNAQAMNAQAAIADARAQAAQSATSSPTAAPSATTAQQTAAALTAAAGADAPVPKATDAAAGNTYSNIAAQLLGSRTPAPASTPLAAAAPAPAAAAPAASPTSLPLTAAAPALHAATDADGTIAAATSDPTATPGFGVAAPAASAAGNTSGTLTLSGPAQQWQQPLQQALGDRLQMQLSNNSQQAVIRLEPPNLGSIEIAIRHADGALQVNLSASNSDVLRQLHTIGDSVRQDLSSRQYTDVAVTVSATPRSGGAQNFADGGGDNRQRQSGQDGDENTPGRALSDAEQPYSAAFALNDRE